MNINELGLFLPILLAVATAFALFAIKIVKWPLLEQIDRVTPDTVIQRRRLPRKLNVICMLPMYEDSRPEQRLW